LLIQDIVRSKSNRSSSSFTSVPRNRSLQQAARTKRLPH
jgi:hypothetical protein